MNIFNYLIIELNLYLYLFHQGSKELFENGNNVEGIFLSYL